MVASRIPFVLFFHRGMNPTDEHMAAASAIGARIGYRNADQVGATAMSALEECDGVAGDVPDRYAAAFPSAQTAIDEGRLLRISDLDRRHGPVNSIDNELARSARPPAIGVDRLAATAATRPVGAITAVDGGFVAPVPGNPDNLLGFGSERAENGLEGANREGEVSHRNPQGLADTGVVLPRTGSDTGAVTGPVAEGGGQDGFRAPTPAPAADEGDTGPKGRKARGGDTGSTGGTGSTGAAS